MQKIFNELYTFSVVVRSAYFLEAARTLGTTHTTIQRQINKLEENLGTKLVYRNNRGIKLTDMGNNLYHNTKHHFDDLDQVVDDISLNQKLLDGSDKKVKILLSVGMAMYFIDQIYPTLRQILPEQSIELHTYTLAGLEQNSSIIKSLTHQYDIIVMESFFYHLIQSDYWRVVLTRKDYMALYASKDYVKRNGKPKTVEDLTKHNCIYPNLFDKAIWSLFDENNQEHRVVVKGKITVDMFAFMPQLILSGYGIGLCPGSYFDIPKLREAPLVHILPQYRSAQYDYSLIKNTQSQNQKETENVSKAIKDIVLGNSQREWEGYHKNIFEA